MSPGCKLDTVGRCVHHKDAIIVSHVIEQYEFHLGLVSFDSFTVNLSYLWIAVPFLTFSPQIIWDCQSCFFLNSFENWPSQAEVSVADTSAPIHNQFFPLSYVWEGCKPPLKLGFAKSHQHRLTNTFHITKWQLGTVAQQSSFNHFARPTGRYNTQNFMCVDVRVFIVKKYCDTCIKFSHWCTYVLRKKAQKKGRIKRPPPIMEGLNCWESVCFFGVKSKEIRCRS